MGIFSPLEGIDAVSIASGSAPNALREGRERDKAPAPRPFSTCRRFMEDGFIIAETYGLEQGCQRVVGWMKTSPLLFEAKWGLRILLKEAGLKSLVE
jgi:hypothetical protein